LKLLLQNPEGLIDIVVPNKNFQSELLSDVHTVSRTGKFFSALATHSQLMSKGVRGLRVTGNTIKGMAILAGGSPTHC
jgi:hypothetical protein